MANSIAQVLFWISTFINIFTTKVWIPLIPRRAITSVTDVGKIKALAVPLTSEACRVLRCLVASLIPHGPVEHRGDHRPVPHAIEILPTEIEGLVFDYECITARIEAPHIAVVVHAAHTGIVVEEHLGYRCMATPDPIARPVGHVVDPGTHREAAARESVPIGSRHHGNRVASDGRELVLGVRERERGEDGVDESGQLLLYAGLGVAVHADEGVDAELAVERYVKDFNVGIPQVGLGGGGGGDVAVDGEVLVQVATVSDAEGVRHGDVSASFLAVGRYSLRR